VCSRCSLTVIENEASSSTGRETRASARSRRMLADRAPKPDVPAQVRRPPWLRRCSPQLSPGAFARGAATASACSLRAGPSPEPLGAERYKFRSPRVPRPQRFKRRGPAPRDSAATSRGCSIAR
jgi:hypothetical protein